MRLFHTTDVAAAILTDGFIDSEGGYMFARLILRGVFLATTPADVNDGATGQDVLEVVLPDSLDLSAWAILDGGAVSPWEWCIPAATLNDSAAVRLLNEEEVWTAKGW
jgi:hypothetical protein